MSMPQLLMARALLTLLEALFVHGAYLRTCLVIPRFVVDCKTEGLFRNLMALEQCHYPSHAYICNYIMLLDFLINTKDDVELLVDKRIIVNSLGSNKAVALMVNKLGQEIVEKNSCFYEARYRILTGTMTTALEP
uniref:Secreted protein n=1 Tax=Fagus sylvatica TaxID=28930 RepID=A0A2N9I4D0_FAGSY